MDQGRATGSEVRKNKRTIAFPIGRLDLSQLIVFDVNPESVASALFLAFPMIPDSKANKIEVSINQRFGLGGPGCIRAARRQTAQKIIPVGWRPARCQHLA